jgi:hypothetical protein
MGKKPDPLASDVSAKKVVDSKTPVAAAAAPPAQICTPPAEEAVRIGAYLRWDAAGRPGGDGVRFWLEAEQEMLAGNVPVAVKTSQKR